MFPRDPPAKALASSSRKAFSARISSEAITIPCDPGTIRMGAFPALIGSSAAVRPNGTVAVFAAAAGEAAKALGCEERERDSRRAARPMRVAGRAIGLKKGTESWMRVGR